MSHPQSLRHGLGKGFIRILLIPLVFFTLLSVFFLYRSIAGVIQRDQEILGEILETSIRDNLSAPVASMEEAIQLYDIIGNEQDYNAFLEIFVERNPLFLTVYVLDPQGIVINAPLDQRHILGNDHSGYAYYNPQLGSSHINWSSTFISPDDSTITYAFSMVNDLGYSFVGYYSLVELQNLINLLSHHSIGDVAVVDSRRFFLAHSDFQLVEQRVQERQVPLGEGQLVVSYSGRRTIIRQIHLEDINLYIFMYRDFFQLYYQLIALAVITLLFFAVVIFLVISFAKTQSRRISQHIEQLVQGSSRIAGGTYNLSIGHSQYQELNHLADNFNIMARTIKEAIEDLSLSREEQLALNRSLREQIQRVKENEEQLRLVMEYSYDGIVFIDREYRILRMSQRAVELFNLEEEPRHYIGKESHGVLLSKDDFCLECIAEKALEDQIAQNTTIEIGSRLIEQTAVPVTDDTQQMKGIILCYKDITEKDELQRKLNQALKLEAVGRFAGGIAHDFNNILQVIFGVTELLRQPHSKEEFNSYLEDIMTISEKGEKLVRQLLAFCRIEGQTSVLCSLDLLIKDISSMLEHLVGDNISLSLDLQAHGIDLELVPGQIEQVLVNLVVNARDAMKAGVISIRTFLQSQDDQEFAVLEVEDQGTGIPRAIQEKIFDPFFSTKEVGKGSGLGLATVFGIVESHGAVLELDTMEGEGATFRILFPLKTQD